MDFVPQPEEAKKFGSMKWLKWHIYRHPNVFLIALPVPFVLYIMGSTFMYYTRELEYGTYVPNVVMNRYVICRSDDWLAKSTPKRYTN